ncbi:hypothetical protein SNE40_007072 [Patella caerulea]|uniref:SOCS box domain-containing protein n=1 Tax=Patella caerulea TaxID=87958 RepID=A0AAN8JT49_PATCE
MSPEGDELVKANAPEVVEFFKAIKSNNTKCVTRMLKKKLVETNVCDPDDPCKSSALLVACLLGYIEIVSILLKDKNKPADVNAENLIGVRPIWVVAQTGNGELAELLLAGNTCQVNYIDKDSGCSPLYKAVLGNHTEVAQHMIHVGADVNTRRIGLELEGETALIKAIQFNNKDMCELLINSLCDLKAKTSGGLTALHYAVSYCRYEICDLLLENKIKLHSSTPAGATAMTVAIDQNNPVMVQKLLDWGYKMDSKYKYLETPLEQAIKVHHEDCAMVLVKYGCCVVRKKHKESYFKMAVNEKLERLMELLVHVYPWFLKEKWIWKRQWPVSIYNTPSIIEWLIVQSSNTKTLRYLCRSRIFRTLGHFPSVKMDQLPIPDNIREYISLNNTKVALEENVLLSDDCPYDCPAMCSRRYCPPLDISDTDEDIEY